MSSKPATGSSHPPRHTPLAIVVNDDKTQLMLLSSLLRAEGFETLSFETATDTLSALQSSAPPDLIVTDLYMPGMDGWRFCRLLKTPAYKPINAVPLLIVSATFSGANINEMAMGVGANAFLPAPVDAHTFKEVIKKIMAGERPAQTPSVLIVDDDVLLTAFLARTFSENGFSPTVAHSLKDALAKAHSLQPVLALVDHHLPDGMGGELLEEIRRLSPGTSMIMMTSDSDYTLAATWFEKGASAYLLKPFDQRHLLIIAQKVCRENLLMWVGTLLEHRILELQKSEARFHSLVETTSDWIWEMDSNGRYTYSCPRVMDILGYTPAEIVGMTIFALMPPAEAKRVYEVFQEAVQSRRPLVKLENTNRHKHGHLVVLETNGVPVKDVDGNLLGYRGVAHDITARKMMEMRLQESEARYKALFTGAAEGMLVADMQTKQFHYVNPAACRMFGYTEEEFLKLCVSDVHPKESLDHAMSVFERVCRGEKMFVDGIPCLRKDGTNFYANVNGVQVVLDGHTYILGLFSDITENKLAEAEIRRLNMDLERRVMKRTTQLSETVDELKNEIAARKRTEEERDQQMLRLIEADKMASVGLLAAGVAHEINNPCNFVLLNIGVVERAWHAVLPILDEHAPDITLSGFPYEEGKIRIERLLKGAREGCERIKNIVASLKEYARKDSGHTRTAISINYIAETAVTLMASVLKKHTAKFKAKYASPSPCVIGNSQQLEQVVINILQNACDALSDSSKSIELETGVRSEGKVVFLRVSDEGCGIEPDVTKFLFDPFFTTKRSKGGTGLGLSISLGIVKDHGGEIVVESKPGAGTVVTILLPAATGKTAPPAD